MVPQGTSRRIVCLTGSPATGKTTTAEYLVAHHNAVHIPEVNILHPKHTHPDPEPESWYIDRQVERCQAALQASSDLVILDGDPYQPVWLHWIFPEFGFNPWWRDIEIFAQRTQRLVVPDFYVYLHTDPDERFRREALRTAERGYLHRRAIAKYERYAPMLVPGRAFFQALGEAFPGFVLFIEAIDPETTFAAFRDYLFTPPAVWDLLDAMSSWLVENDIGKYRPGTFTDLPPM